MSNSTPSQAAFARSPFRNLERANPQQLRKRAWWLLLLSFLVPGSAQLLAGNRRFARIVLIATIGFWALVLLLGLLVLPFDGQLLAAIATQSWFMTALTIVLVALTAMYALVALDTLRLLQLGRLMTRDRWIVLVAMVAISGVVTSGFASAANLTASASGVLNTMFVQKGVYLPDNGRYNIMLLGADSGKDRFGIRPDSISVISVDALTGHAVNIGIPRNLQRVQFVEGSPMRKVYPNGWRCGDTCLINAIYKDVTDNHAELYPDAVAKGSTPGIEATRDAVSWVTGLKIHSFVMIDMAAFANLVDALGGVKIDVKERLPIGGKREDLSDVKGWIEPGLQQMDGYTALWYARSRHTTNDYDRMRRQREVEDAILDQVGPVNLALHFSQVAVAGEKLIKTDVPSDMIGTFFNLARKARAQGIDKLELVPPAIDPAYPNFKSIRAMIQKSLKAQG